MNDFDANPQTTKQLLRTSDVAKQLGMSREQVWRLFTTGRIPGYRFDRYLRFSQVDVETFKTAHYRIGTTHQNIVGARPAPMQSQGRTHNVDAIEYRPL